MDTQQERALQLATEAGHILLENGAEIIRVEGTIQRIAKAYGVEDESFFVLSTASSRRDSIMPAPSSSPSKAHNSAVWWR